MAAGSRRRRRSRDSRMCSRLLSGIGGDADEPEQARDRRRDAVARRARIAALRRRRERAQDRQRQARGAARRVDRDVRRIRGSGGCARRPRPTRRGRSSRSRPSSPRAPRPSCPCAPASAASIHGWNSAAAEAGKGQHQVRDVALRVDHDRRDAVERGLLEERDAEPRLAAAGHADADRVRRQVPRVVHQRLGGERVLGGVVAAAEVERAEFFEVGHGAIIRSGDSVLLCRAMNIVNTVRSAVLWRPSRPCWPADRGRSRSAASPTRMPRPTPFSSGRSTSGSSSTRPLRRRWASRPATTAGRTPPRRATPRGSRWRSASSQNCRKFDPAKLDDATRLSWQVFEANEERRIARYRWRNHGYLFDKDGAHASLPAFLINTHRIESEADAVAYVRRLEGIRPLFAQQLERATAAAKQGIAAAASSYFPTSSKTPATSSRAGHSTKARATARCLRISAARSASSRSMKRSANRSSPQAERALLTSVKPAYEAVIAWARDDREDRDRRRRRLEAAGRRRLLQLPAEELHDDEPDRGPDPRRSACAKSRASTTRCAES